MFMICYDLSVKIVEPNELWASRDVVKFFQLSTLAGKYASEVCIN
jgi:hypothetical protein